MYSVNILLRALLTLLLPALDSVLALPSVVARGRMLRVAKALRVLCRVLDIDLLNVSRKVAECRAWHMLAIYCAPL